MRHLRSVLTLGGHESGKDYRQDQDFYAILFVNPSSMHTISFLLQVAQKIAFPFAQTHAF